MKFSPALLFSVAVGAVIPVDLLSGPNHRFRRDVAAAADDKKVPPRHPLQRLERLNAFTDEMLNTWFSFLPSKDAWVEKFAANGARMATAFTRGNQRCGFYDESQEHGGPEEGRKRRAHALGLNGGRKRRSHMWDGRKRRAHAMDDEERYNREDPVEGVRQLTTGYRKWAERYLSQCSGQRQYQHQANRMAKWGDLLQAHLAGQDPESTDKGTH